MIKKLKRLITNLSIASVLLAPMAAPVAVYAQEAPNLEGNLCGGAQTLQVGNQDACADTNDAQTRVNEIIASIINIFSVIVGVVAVIMIIFGGFRYITSGGDSGNISSAKQTIVFAIVGLVVVALAQIIVRFVLSRATGSAA